MDFLISSAYAQAADAAAQRLEDFVAGFYQGLGGAGA